TARASRASPRSNSTRRSRPSISGADALTETRESKAVYPSLRGKRVLITGGGSGIGAGIVEGFVRQGADVTFFDVAEEESRALVDGLGSDRLRFERVDLTDIEATQAAIARLIAEGGPFDILVNNAANDDRHVMDEVTPAYWDQRMNVNLRHLFF